jgi:diaminopimelate decarboxylase/aspartate kinase
MADEIENLTEAEFADSAALGAPDDVANSQWVVMKFGGTSVSTADNWRMIAELVRHRLDAGFNLVVVHSALKGVSNALEEILQSAIGGEISDRLGALKQQHYELAESLGVDGAALLDGPLQELEQLIAGVRLVHEVSVRVRVRVMALGEIMATTLGAAYLQGQQIDAHWQDARDVLISEIRANRSVTQSYLSATCAYDADPGLANELAAHGRVILTQGFIARNEHGETVLLGRGGSDTSAAYFAAKLTARRLEIWTDVPGMFTADPKLVPSARLLVALHFDEAQELASTGSRVLHPRCLSPLRRHGIPLFIRCTIAPHIAGTVISSVTSETEPQVKGVASRGGLTLVSMDGVGMWHEVGFLADAFACFKSHGVSVDLVSTSETNVTVSIDTIDGMLTEDTEHALVTDLAPLCRVRVIRNCAAVSLVGRKIRTILPRIAPALEVFEEEKIHLVSQAANDLNFSFVIEQDQVPRLVSKLHPSIIRKSGGSAAFGASWEELFQGEPAKIERLPPWWLQKRDDLLRLAEAHPNAFVYDADSVRQAAACLLNMKPLDRVLYAVKANFNADLLRILDDTGVDFECVSPGEVDWLFEVIPGLDRNRILFTPNFAPRSEFEWAFEKGLQVTLDNLHPLQSWPELFENRKIFVRVDPGQGRGHHEHVKTAGVHSKFGIPTFEVDELADLLKQAGTKVVGVHAHSGSGVLDAENWRSVAAELIKVAERFPEVEVLDLGGGLGIAEKPGDKPLDLRKLEETLAAIKAAYPKYRLWLEPGRFLVARAGVLLTHVTQVKGKGDMRYVGVGTGMNSLIRPALYGAYHEIVNLTRADEPATESVSVVGPICETGDRLGSDRLLPPSQESDVILIANTGAYGYVMSSNYNRRKVETELII